MELYLVRHATALEGTPDDARPLSDQGRQRFAEVVKGLKKLGVELDRIYHSPKLRAVQTADLLTPILRGKTEVTPYLADVPSLELLKLIQGSKVALVGHEPWISDLCAWLLTGEKQGYRFPFKKGGVAHLEGEAKPGGMLLLAFLPPRVLRNL